MKNRSATPTISTNSKNQPEKPSDPIAVLYPNLRQESELSENKLKKLVNTIAQFKLEVLLCALMEKEPKAKLFEINKKYMKILAPGDEDVEFDAEIPSFEIDFQVIDAFVALYNGKREAAYKICKQMSIENERDFFAGFAFNMVKLEYIKRLELMPGQNDLCEYADILKSLSTLLSSTYDFLMPLTHNKQQAISLGIRSGLSHLVFGVVMLQVNQAVSSIDYDNKSYIKNTTIKNKLDFQEKQLEQSLNLDNAIFKALQKFMAFFAKSETIEEVQSLIPEFVKLFNNASVSQKIALLKVIDQHSARYSFDEKEVKIIATKMHIYYKATQELKSFSEELVRSVAVVNIKEYNDLKTQLIRVLEVVNGKALNSKVDNIRCFNELNELTKYHSVSFHNILSYFPKFFEIMTAFKGESFDTDDDNKVSLCFKGFIKLINYFRPHIDHLEEVPQLKQVLLRQLSILHGEQLYNFNHKEITLCIEKLFELRKFFKSNTNLDCVANIEFFTALFDGSSSDKQNSILNLFKCKLDKKFNLNFTEKEVKQIALELAYHFQFGVQYSNKPSDGGLENIVLNIGNIKSDDLWGFAYNRFKEAKACLDLNMAKREFLDSVQQTPLDINNISRLKQIASGRNKNIFIEKILPVIEKEIITYISEVEKIDRTSVADFKSAVAKSVSFLIIELLTLRLDKKTDRESDFYLELFEREIEAYLSRFLNLVISHSEILKDPNFVKYFVGELNYKPYKIEQISLPAKASVFKTQYQRDIEDFLTVSIFSAQSYKDFKSQHKEYAALKVKRLSEISPALAKRFSKVIELIGLNKSNKIVELHNSLLTLIKEDPSIWYYHLLMVQIYIDIKLHVNSRRKLNFVAPDYDRGAFYADQAYRSAQAAGETILLPFILSYKQTLALTYDAYQDGQFVTQQLKLAFRSRLFHNTPYLKDSHKFNLPLNSSVHLMQSDDSAYINQIANNIYVGMMALEQEFQILRDLFETGPLQKKNQNIFQNINLPNSILFDKYCWFEAIDSLNNLKIERGLAKIFTAININPLNLGTLDLLSQFLLWNGEKQMLGFVKTINSKLENLYNDVIELYMECRDEEQFMLQYTPLLIAYCSEVVRCSEMLGNTCVSLERSSGNTKDYSSIKYIALIFEFAAHHFLVGLNAGSDSAELNALQCIISPYGCPQLNTQQQRILQENAKNIKWHEIDNFMPSLGSRPKSGVANPVGTNGCNHGIGAVDYQ